MKRGCFPLKGDHCLLTPETHSRLGVNFSEQVWSGGVASPSGHLCDFTRRSAAFPNRLLRFEDETEMEAESRYLERQQQRRQVWQRGVLASKPDPSLFMNIHGGKRKELVISGQQRGRTLSRSGALCDPHRKEMESGTKSNICLCPTVKEISGRGSNTLLLLRTELLKESYIGCVTPADTGRKGGSSESMDVRWRANQTQFNGIQTPPSTDLPINPYDPYPAAPPLQHCGKKYPTNSTQSVMLSHDGLLNGTEAGKYLTNSQQSLNSTQRVLHTGSHRKGTHLYLCSSDETSPPSGCTDGQARQTSNTDQRKDVSAPGGFSRRDKSPHLSFRGLLSSVRLRRPQTSSLDRLSSKIHSAGSDSSNTRKSCILLKKSPSVQSLCGGSPTLPLRKSSTVPSFASELKKKDHSDDYRSAAEQFQPRCLSTEDISRPCSVRSVGRVLQVCSDGTLVLELNQPKGQTLGFILSQGKGRPDSGMYVDDFMDQANEKLFSGLLGAGDEILEVNGEKVACLSVEQVTHRLRQNPSVTVRVLRPRRTSAQ